MVGVRGLMAASVFIALTLVHDYQGVSQWCSGTQLLPLSSRGRLGWGFALRFNRQN